MRISTESVITRTKVRLGLMDTTSQDATLELFIQEGARHIDAVDSYIVSCETIDVDCSRVRLPDQYSEVICFQPTSPNTTTTCTCSGTTSTTNNFCTCGMYYFVNRGVLTNFCSLGGRGCWGNFYDVQNGYLILPEPTTITQVKLWYRGLNVDQDGLMILNDYQERGLSAYAAFEFANSGQNYRNYSPGQIASWSRLWTAQVNRIRGKAAQNDHRQHIHQFTGIARALILWPSYSLNL